MTRTRWILLGLLLALGVLVLMIAGRVRSSPAYVMERNFEKVQVGMTREEVHEILGDECGAIGGFVPWTENWSLDGRNGSNWLLMIDYRVSRTEEETTRVHRKELERPPTLLARWSGYLGL